MEELRKFLRDRWLIEPFINESIAYSFVVLAFEIIRRFIEGFLHIAEFNNALLIIREFLFICTAGLLGFHAIALLFIRVFRSLSEEWMMGDLERSSVEEKAKCLNPEPANFDSAVNMKPNHREKVQND